MKTITLPFYDHSGKLSPIVIESMQDGATSARNPDDADTILLTFKKDVDAKAFEAKVATLSASDSLKSLGESFTRAAEALDKLADEGTDPVDDQPEA